MPTVAVDEGEFVDVPEPLVGQVAVVICLSRFSRKRQPVDEKTRNTPEVMWNRPLIWFASQPHLLRYQSVVADLLILEGNILTEKGVIVGPENRYWVDHTQ